MAASLAATLVTRLVVSPCRPAAVSTALAGESAAGAGLPVVRAGAAAAAEAAAAVVAATPSPAAMPSQAAAITAPSAATSIQSTPAAV